VIRRTPGILQRIRQSLFWCATSCVEAQVDTLSILIVMKPQFGNHASEGQSSYSNTFPIANKQEPSMTSRPVKHVTRWGLWYVPPAFQYLYSFNVLPLFYCLIQTRNDGRSILYPCVFPQWKTSNWITKKKCYIICCRARCQVGFRIWLATCLSLTAWSRWKTRNDTACSWYRRYIQLDRYIILFFFDKTYITG
jgi:hypothetical protein